MSFRQQFETVVYFDCFQNIDLFFQGYYFFKARLFYEDPANNIRVYSHPSFCSFPTDPNIKQTQFGPKKSPIMLINQSKLPSMPVFSDGESPLSTTPNSFAEAIGSETSPLRFHKTSLINQTKGRATPMSANEVTREVTPPRVLNESPFESRQCVVEQDFSTLLGTNRQHNLRRVECDKADNCYRSKVFYIRYSDENVRIGDVVAFKTELETSFECEARRQEAARQKLKQAVSSTVQRKGQRVRFFMEISLYFKEATPQEIESQSNVSLRIDEQVLRRFTKVAEKRYALANLQKGAFVHYYPVQFTAGYFSCLQVVIHSSPIQFKYKEASLFASIYNAHLQQILKQNNHRDASIYLAHPIKTDSDLLIEALSPKKPVLEACQPLNDKKEGMVEFLFAQTVQGRRKLAKASKRDVRHLQKLFVSHLVEAQKTLVEVLMTYVEEMKPATRGQFLDLSVPESINKDLFQLLQEACETPVPYTPKTAGFQRPALIRQYSDTSSDSIQINSPSISPKCIQQSIISHRGSKKVTQASSMFRSHASNFNQHAQVNQLWKQMDQLRQKEREKSTPPRVSVSRSPIQMQPLAPLQKHPSTILTLTATDEQKANSTRQFDQRKMSTRNQAYPVSPYNRQLMIKNAQVAHLNAVAALQKNPGQFTQIDPKNHRSPARHVKLKLSKRNTQDSNHSVNSGYQRAKSPSNALFGSRPQDTAREKHAQLSQILAERNEARVVHDGGLHAKRRQARHSPATKAAVPSIKQAVEKSRMLDELSMTSEEDFPRTLTNVSYSRRERPSTNTINEATNLSSLELRSQFIVKGRADWYETQEEESKLNRSQLSLPTEADFKTINSLNGQFSKPKHLRLEEEQKRFQIRQHEATRNAQGPHQTQPKVTAAQLAVIHAMARKRENMSPQLSQMKRLDEDFDRQTPAIFSKHSVITNRADTSYLDQSLVSTMNRSKDSIVAPGQMLGKRKLTFITDKDDSFLTNEETLIKHFAKRGSREIASMELQGVSKRGHIQPQPRKTEQTDDYDAFKTCIVLERQIGRVSAQIQAVWLKLIKAVFVDPQSVEKVLSQKYLEGARKFYSQTIVEVYSNLSRGEEDLNDQEGLVVRQSIKDSGMSQMLHKHYQLKLDSHRLTPLSKHPFEEAKQHHLKHLVKNKSALNMARKVPDRFSFGIQQQETDTIDWQEWKQERPPVTDRSWVGRTNDTLSQFSDLEGGKRSASIQRQVTLGARPLSPKQMEKSFALARNRRRDCSQVREVQDTELSSQSDEGMGKIEVTQKLRSKSQLHTQGGRSGFQDKHRPLQKVTMPIQEIETTDRVQLSPTKQFEPIIMEEVYYNDCEPEEPPQSTIFNNNDTPRSKSPSRQHLQLTTLVREEMNRSKQKGAVENQAEALAKTTQLDKAKMAGPFLRPGFRDMHTTEAVDFDCYSETVSHFNVTGSNSVADRLRQEKVANKPILNSQSVHLHLFVFVHGFQATSSDMRTFRNHLQTALPQSIFLVSQCNEKDTDSRIEQLGLRLANEVQEFIFTNLCGARRPASGKKMFLEKLSFIGHSLGGIIIREALKHLGAFKQKMHAYVSLGSPHLGYMYNSSSIVDAGMWLIKKWKSSDSLKQLSMSDASNKENSFLFQLSKSDSLKHFKYVMLVSSFQDNYAPHDSARVQMCRRAAEVDAGKGKVYSRMVQNILSSLQCKKLYRLDVNFKIENTNFANFIGRTAHILLIECEPFFLSLIYKYSEVFCE